MSILQRFKAFFGSEIQRLEYRYSAIAATYNEDVRDLNDTLHNTYSRAVAIGSLLEAEFDRAKADIEAIIPDLAVIEANAKLIKGGFGPSVDALQKALTTIEAAVQNAKTDLTKL